MLPVVGDHFGRWMPSSYRGLAERLLDSAGLDCCDWLRLTHWTVVLMMYDILLTNDIVVDF